VVDVLARIAVVAGLLVGLSGLVGVGPVPVAEAQERATSTPLRDSVDHRAFDQVLARYVDEQGNVDYAALKARSDSVLAPFLQQLATTDPSGLNRDARLAFWINAYNAYTLKLIVDHYPVENIWAVTPGPAEPKDDSPFALDVGPVADTVRTLDEIEHEIIRTRFDEPRIHFALVCAAMSCPRLRREAYTGPRLDEQLDEQAHAFFHNSERNRIPADAETIALSRILKWYGEDFGSSEADLQRFIAPYFEGTVRSRLEDAAYEVTFLSYDWTLNDQ
jgi:hypothetical protein